MRAMHTTSTTRCFTTHLLFTTLDKRRRDETRRDEKMNETKRNQIKPNQIKWKRNETKQYKKKRKDMRDMIMTIYPTSGVQLVRFSRAFSSVQRSMVQKSSCYVALRCVGVLFKKRRLWSDLREWVSEWVSGWVTKYVDWETPREPLLQDGRGVVWCDWLPIFTIQYRSKGSGYAG